MTAGRDSHSGDSPSPISDRASNIDWKAPEAAKAFRSLQAYHRAEVRDAQQRHLRNEPTRVSKSRIKRLRGLSQPQYRLRVGEVRVFYDVTREAVEVLAIVTKAEAGCWLAERGTPSAPSSPG